MAPKKNQFLTPREPFERLFIISINLQNSRLVQLVSTDSANQEVQRPVKGKSFIRDMQREKYLIILYDVLNIITTVLILCWL